MNSEFEFRRLQNRNLYIYIPCDCFFVDINNFIFHLLNVRVFKRFIFTQPMKETTFNISTNKMMKRLLINSRDLKERE